MAALPDDVWLQVFRFGLQQDFSYRDLCTIPFVCRRFKRIARDDSLWNILYSKDWPSHSKTNENDKSDTHSKSQALWMRYEGEEQDNLGSSSLTAVQLKPQRKRTASIAFGRTWKEKYVLRFQREKYVLQSAHKRKVLRAQSKVVVLKNLLKELNHQMDATQSHLKALLQKMQLLKQARMTLEIDGHCWQPQAVARHQQLLVEQQPMHSDSQLQQCQNDVLVSKMNIASIVSGIKSKRKQLERATKEFEALSFNPAM